MIRNKSVLTIAAILGFAIPYVALIFFIYRYGFDIPVLISQIFASYGSTFFALDVILCSLFIIFMCLMNTKMGNRRYFVIGTAIIVGPSCALPLYYRLQLEQ